MQPTRRSFNATLLSLLTTPTLLRGAPTTRPTYPGRLPAPDAPLSLWYRSPAVEWTDALPLGNGSLGAMVYGGVQSERLQLNHDTLWSGHPTDTNNPAALQVLPQIRDLVTQGKYAAAGELAKQMMGPFTQSYQPMADLRLTFPHPGDITHYRRHLDLSTAIHTTQYQVNDIIYTRECFISHPDELLVLHLTASKPGAISLTATMDTLHAGAERSATPDSSLTLTAKAPTHVDPKNHETNKPLQYNDQTQSTQFRCHLRALPQGGTTSTDPNTLTITAADSVTLLLSATTSYDGPLNSPTKPLAEITTNHSYEDLRARHISDHQSLFNRVTLDLGPSPAAAPDLQTDDRLNQFGPDDPHNIALHFQYGRYLLISSARGTLPPNLQGLWNDSITPPWSSNYTTNINAEMNHWPAEPTNLPECHQPLFSFLESLAQNGAKTAQIEYGCRGWCCHHNSDAWAQTSMPGHPGGNASWAVWPMAGAWLCSHLFDHYRFSLDQAFLRDRAYPVLKGAAQFFLDFLTTDAQGHLVTNPSTSPENEFIAPDGQRASISIASTMDMALIHDLFTNTLESATLLSLDPAFRQQLATALPKLLPPTIAPDGRLREWSQDFTETDPHHRHVSHLWGVYPGRQLTPEAAPTLFAAARKSLEVRGDIATGWSSGWKINLWARFRDGDHAMNLIRRTLRVAPGGVYPNLFGSHPPFQMDGNFAFPAGIAELLLQSHTNTLHLLPALPQAWPAGAITGLRARGNFTLDLAWANHTLTSATLHSHSGTPCKLRYADLTATLPTQPGQTYQLSPTLKIRPTS